MTPLTLQQAEDLLRSDFGKSLKEMTQSYTTTIAWGHTDEAGGVEVTSGSTFFVRTPNAYFAVTAGHVLRKFLADWSADQSLECQLWNIREFPLADRILDIGQRVDIGTFRVTEDEVGLCRKTFLSTWPPLVPDEGGWILYAGFPKAGYSQLQPRSLGVKPYYACGLATSVTEWQIKAQVNHEELTDAHGERPPVGYDIGGMSGGPVLTMIDSGVLSWRLGGVIAEGQPATDTMIAERADVIRSDGRIRR